MSESEPEPLPGEGEAAAAPRPQVIESIVEYKARQLAVLKKIAKEQELDEDSNGFVTDFVGSRIREFTSDSPYP